MIAIQSWTAGDSEFERFEAARGFYVLSYESRRRPGKSLAGFQKALARIPVRQLWALAQGVRDQIQRNYAGRLVIDGYVPMGCDGSRVECPHEPSAFCVNSPADFGRMDEQLTGKEPLSPV